MIRRLFSRNPDMQIALLQGLLIDRYRHLLPAGEARRGSCGGVICKQHIKNPPAHHPTNHMHITLFVQSPKSDHHYLSLIYHGLPAQPPSRNDIGAGE